MNILAQINETFFCQYKDKDWYKKYIEKKKQKQEEDNDFALYSKNTEKINKIKLKNIKDIIKYVHKENKIKKIIDKIVIFGSSVRDDCTDESDIDICIYTKKDVKDRDLLRVYGNIEIEASNKCDIFINYLQDEKFLQKIERYGVIVYGN